MKKFFQTLWRWTASSALAALVWGVSFIVLWKQFDVHLLLSVVYGGGIGTASFFFNNWRMKRKQRIPLPEHVTSEEFEYVQEQVQEARALISQISKSRYKVKSFAMVDAINRIQKVSKKMVSLMEEQPERYRGANEFFNQYLPSSVNVITTYSTLLNQPVRTPEMVEAMRESETAIRQLAGKIEDQLAFALSDECMRLNAELSLIKQSLNEQVLVGAKKEEHL